MKAFNTLFRIELKLSIRDMNIPIFGIALPIIVAVVIGLVSGNKPAFEGADYSMITVSFGAFTAIAICATGLMGMPLTVADYRHKKVLKRYMVTPVSPALLLLVQFVINLIMSVISLVLLYFICTLFWDYHMAGNIGWFLLSYLLVVLSIYSIGMMLASIAPNLKTANLLCTLVYFPMLFFSGATIPYEIMPKGAQVVMDVLPLTQGIKLLKGTSLGLPIENTIISIVILGAVSLICMVLSLKFFRWE
ncbi:MAG: transporter permease [Herbinix sp.]|jgi:ABC-2 type transport system permease protein|nr:transporter permease [Herbinix sp.]